MKIICDTQEKKDLFLFKSYADVSLIHRKLDTGDYSIEGFENEITVDRKASTGELYGNLGNDYKRFKKELDRMGKITHSFFICAFPYSDLSIFPERSGIPNYRWKYLKMTGSFLRKKINDIQEEYPNIQFLFYNNKYEAENATYSILKEFMNGRQT